MRTLLVSTLVMSLVVGATTTGQATDLDRSEKVDVVGGPDPDSVDTGIHGALGREPEAANADASGPSRKAVDPVARPRPANGRSLMQPLLALPLKTFTVSSGFGMRPDPLGQWPALAPSGGPDLKPGARLGAVLPSQTRQAVNVATPRGRLHGLSQGGSTRQVAPSATPQMVMHSGVDLVAPPGAPVYAVADGVIVGAAPNGAYGNWIRIDHAGNLATVYGHLLAFAPGIAAGETVRQGTVIGFVGSTGRSTGAHLHFELHQDGSPVDPARHLQLAAANKSGIDSD